MHLLTVLLTKLLDIWYHVSWAIAVNRMLFVLLFMLLGLVLANLPRSHGISRTIGSYLLRSVIGILAGLTISAGLVAASAVTHAADVRWLPPSQRQTPSVSAPAVPSAPSVPLIGSALGTVTNSLNSGLKEMANGTNTAIRPLFELELQARAVQVSARVIVQYFLISTISGAILAGLIYAAYKLEWWNQRRRLNRAEQRIKALEDRLDQALGPPVAPARAQAKRAR